MSSPLVYLSLLKKRREQEDLNEERKQVMESLQQRIDELQKKVKETEDAYVGADMFIRDKYFVKKADRERTKGLEKEAEIKRLKEEHAQLMERKQEQQHQVQRHTLYQDLMERVAKMAKFEDVHSLTDHFENLLLLRGQLYQKENEAQEKVDQLRQALLTQEDQHHLLHLHNKNQLSKLHNELENTCFEALKWEKKWDDIQETAAKKTLLLVEIKMVSLNLYETTDDNVEGEGGVDVNDTEKQLYEVKMFIQDHSDIKQQYQSLSHRHNNGQKREEQKRDEANEHIAKD